MVVNEIKHSKISFLTPLSTYPNRIPYFKKSKYKKIKPYSLLLYLFLLINPLVLVAQYQFSGYVDKDHWQGDVYLSLIEDYRKTSGIHPEQIIQKVSPDSTGYFVFSDNNLPVQNSMYRIQVENCFTDTEQLIHFKGHCANGKEILFVANNKDTLSIPFSFDKEMFCSIVSTNQKSKAFIKVDSIINEMQFAFNKYRSATNRKINSKKWCTILQEYGASVNEPLIELYIYSFLSNKTNELHAYYLEDLATNSYYDQLLERLHQKYPNSTYTKQYGPELASDKFLIHPFTTSSTNWWLWGVLLLLAGSLLLNLFLFRKSRRQHPGTTADKNLTAQEQKVLDLILEDKTNKEIATAMFVSLSTVKTHINNLYKKLQVHSREEVKLLKNNA